MNARAAPFRASALEREFGMVSALWRRDMTLLLRQRSRWLGVVLQPLLFWVVIGSGLSGITTLSAQGQPAAGSPDYLAYFLPGIVAMVVLFTAVFATMSVIEDRQRGFLQQVVVAPSSRASVVVGKLAGVTTMSLIQALLCVAVAPLAGISLLSIHWPALIAVLVVGSFALAAINFSLAWVIDTTQGYHAILGVVMLPLWVMSGAMFPPGLGTSASSGWLGWAMAADPLTYLVDGLRNAMSGGHDPLASTPLMTALAVLSILAIGATVLAVRTLERKLEGTRA